MSNIANIDKNLEVKTVIVKDGVSFYNVRSYPFSVYGLYDAQNGPIFRRLPQDVADATNNGVSTLAKHTAGGRVRFCTDSEFVCIKATLNNVSLFPHMPASNASGFDMFIDFPDGSESRYVKTFMPPWHTTDEGYESKIDLGSKKLRYFTINLPSYSGVSDLLVGVADNATIGEGLKYRDISPIVYYGSSITQGGCASRPGNIYQNVICRRNNIDYINFGFSGSGRGEDAICEYMASLEMSAFVSDYDHNAPNPDHLRATHYKLYETIRASHPNIPYIMISKCDVDGNYADSLARRDVIYESYSKAHSGGDRNVYFLDGASIFRGPYQSMCTVDNCHPNDLGFALMADAIGAELDRAFTQLLI